MKPVGSGFQRRFPPPKQRDQKEYRSVKSFIEDESLFKDIERSTEYQDPLNLNAMEQSVQSESAAVDVDEINFEEKSVQKTHSRSHSRKIGPQHQISVQSGDLHNRNRNIGREA